MVGDPSSDPGSGRALLNDKELLGERFAIKPWNNVVHWTIIVVLLALSLVLAVQVVAPKLFPAG